MSEKWVPLGQLAHVSLGFKSLQNDFFYINQPTIDTFGIEPEFYVPILMLADLDGNCFEQSVTNESFLLTCSESESSLKGTGVLRYIRTMATKTATQKKQSGNPQTIREALEKQGGQLWYGPKASVSKAHIWIRKAFGETFSPFIFRSAVLVDQRCNKVEPAIGLEWTSLASYMTSSIFSLSLEVNGAAGLGGGALEVATRKLSEIPVPDLRAWDEQQRETLCRLAATVWTGTRPQTWRGRQRIAPELAALDEFILTAIESSVPASRMHSDIQDACGSRYILADDKKRSAKQKTNTDIGSVARSIAESVQALLDSRRFPEEFQEGQNGTITVHLIQAKSYRLTLHPMLGEAELQILSESGACLYEYTGPTEVAELVRHAVLMGRREFDITSDRSDAQQALTKFLRWINEIHQRINAGIQSSALGTGYETVLQSRVFELLRMHPEAGSTHLSAELSFSQPSI